MTKHARARKTVRKSIVRPPPPDCDILRFDRFRVFNGTSEYVVALCDLYGGAGATRPYRLARPPFLRIPPGTERTFTTVQRQGAGLLATSCSVSSVVVRLGHADPIGKINGFWMPPGRFETILETDVEIRPGPRGRGFVASVRLLYVDDTGIFGTTRPMFRPYTFSREER